MLSLGIRYRIAGNIGGTKHCRFHLETGKIRVNFDGLLLKFMCGWGLLNTCTYTHFQYVRPAVYLAIMLMHVYKNVSTPILGDELEYRREADNDLDRYAVAVVRRGVVVALTRGSTYVMALLGLLFDFLELLCR